MPKVIQPRRHDKALTAEQFWDIRNANKTPTLARPSQAHRQQEVSNRYRYVKPSEQAKNFNPLSYFRTDSVPMKDENQTYISNFIQANQGIVPPQLVPVKRLAISSKSIIHNKQEIYNLLWRNLQMQDAWELLQALIRDTAQLDITIWIQSGLQRLAEVMQQLCGLTFIHPHFQRMFSTLCIFIQNNFDQIDKQIQTFFTVFASTFLKHSNKHIRRCSLQTLSYLLTNLTEEQSESFMCFLLQRQRQDPDFFTQEFSVAKILVQRLSLSKGCLTAASLGEYLGQIQSLTSMSEEQEDEDMKVLIRQVIIEYVFVGLQLLSVKASGQSSEGLLFDIDYVVQALVKLCEKYAEKYSWIVVSAIFRFIALYETQAARFEPNTQREATYLQQLWNRIAKFVQANAHIIQQVQEKTDYGLALLSVKSTQQFIFNPQIIQYYQKHPQAVLVLIDFIDHLQPELDKKVVEIILLLSKNLLISFLTHKEQTNTVYKLLLILKRTSIQQLIQSSWLQITLTDLKTALENCQNNQNQLLVMLRLLTFIKIEPDQVFVDFLKNQSNLILGQYEAYLGPLLEDNHGQEKDCYDWRGLSRQMLLYSHHEIPWLSQALNLFQSYSMLFQHLQTASSSIYMPQTSNIWSQLLVNRPLALSLLNHTELIQNDNFISTFLASRHRTVRHQTLQLLKTQLQGHQQVVSMLLQIDEEDVDLESERDVKRQFGLLQERLSSTFGDSVEAADKLFRCLLSWSLGFAFTGFKLIQPSFLSFLSELLKLPLASQHSGVLFEFLKYYHYRHSRFFQQDLQDNKESKHIYNQFTISENYKEISSLVSQDLQLEAMETVEWIGLERVSQAIKMSAFKGKNNLGEGLNFIVKSYFEGEFSRQTRMIKQQDQIEVNSVLLLPIKTRFLATILNICPVNYLPPFECLHFLSSQYLQVSSVRALKQHSWQLLWQEKDPKKQKKNKNQLNEKIKSSVNLQQLSPQQQAIYLNYLWRMLLESNHHRNRNIMEHVRNQLPANQGVSPCRKLLQICFASLRLDDLLNEGAQGLEVGVRRLSRLNRKVLLSHLFILKGMVVYFKHQVDKQQITTLLMTLIRLVYPPAANPVSAVEPVEAILQQELHRQQLEQNQEELPQLQSVTSDGPVGWQLYKPHRKQLHKLLYSFCQHHHMSPQQLNPLLASLIPTSPVALAKATRSSVPGVLPILSTLSEQKGYCLLLVENNQVVSLLCEIVRVQHDKPIKKCYQLWLNILHNILLSPEEKQEQQVVKVGIMQEEEALQERINVIIKTHCQGILSAILTYLTVKVDVEEQQQQPRSGRRKGKKQNEDHTRLLAIVQKLMQLVQQGGVEQGWGQYVLQELSKLTKHKTKLSAPQLLKLSQLLQLLTGCLRGGVAGESFLPRVVTLLPHLKQPQQRNHIIGLINSNSVPLNLSQQIISLVRGTNQLQTRSGLNQVISVNFTLFFKAVSQYSKSSQLNRMEEEYFMQNMLGYVDHGEMSVRRAVNDTIKAFLTHVQTQITSTEISTEEGKAWVLLVVRLWRVLLDLLPRTSTQQSEMILWGVVDSVHTFLNWIIQQKQAIARVYPEAATSIDHYRLLLRGNNRQGTTQDYLKMLTSISEATKLKALQLLQHTLKQLSKTQIQALRQEQQNNMHMPSIANKIMLPLLQYLIIHPYMPVHPSASAAPKSNLASSLTLNSLQLLAPLTALLTSSQQKQCLKQLVAKIKYNQIHSKINIQVIKMIGNVIEGVNNGESNAAQLVEQHVQEHGFEHFHSHILQNHAKHHQHTEEEEQEEEQVQGVQQNKQKLPDYFDRLQELEEEEAINRNFLSFDKKLMELQAAEQPEQTDPSEQNSIVPFLRKQILPPLRTMLLFQSRTKEEQEQTSKAKLLLSVTTVKLLLHLPLDTFLRQFNKVVLRLSRILKKRHQGSREYARSCLVTIGQEVGPYLLYAIINTMRGQLKDNFDRHVFNFTVFKIVEGLSSRLKIGDLDYVIPIVLPIVMDQMYGRTAAEKQQLDKGEVPTLKVEAKKKKGMELLQVLSKWVSHKQVNFLINFLEKYLCEHLTSEDNLGKYEQMLGCLSAGLSSNSSVVDPNNASSLLSTIAGPIATLQAHLNFISPDAAQKRSSEWALKTLKPSTRKVGKDQALTLQEQAGKNKSIFAKIAQNTLEKRNTQIITSALIQFYLAILGILVRKQAFTLKTTLIEEANAEKMQAIVRFLVKVIEHRDNRLVGKSLKILHMVLNWNLQDQNLSKQEAVAARMKGMKRQASRKVLLLAQRLTSADEQLLKHCFVMLTDLMTHSAPSNALLPSFLSLIKLHLPVSEDQPHLVEPYILLKTILIKQSSLIFEPAIDQLKGVVRVNVVSSRNKAIVQVGTSILKFYTANEEQLKVALQVAANKGKKQQRKYQDVVKEQLSFYLANLEQSINAAQILTLINECLVNRSPSQIELYSQLVIFSLMTTRTNWQLDSPPTDIPSELDTIITSLLQKINPSKVNLILQKCLAWMGTQRKGPVRFCGFSLSTLIFMNTTTKPKKYQQKISDLIINCLQEEVQVMAEEREALKARKSLDPQWNQIINDMSQERDGSPWDPSAVQAIRLLQQVSPAERVTMELLWRLLQHSDAQLATIALQTLLQQEWTQGFITEQSTQYNVRKTVSQLLFRTDVEQDLVSQLIVKLVQIQQKQPQEDPEARRVEMQIGQLLTGLCLKAHMKPNQYQATLPSLLSHLQKLLTEDPSLLSSPQLSPKLLELSLKLTSNPSFSHLPELHALSQMVKESLGSQQQYYKQVASYEDNKRQRRQEQKIKQKELKVIDYEQLGQMKKKRKTH